MRAIVITTIIFLVGCAAIPTETEGEIYRREKLTQWNKRSDCELKGRRNLDDNESKFEDKLEMVKSICEGMFPDPKRPEGYCE